MPIMKQKMIKAVDLKNNRSVLYVFGDNLSRTGMGGQAKEMRGEPNAVGVATKKHPSTMPSAYFSDDDFNECIVQLDKDLEPIRRQLTYGGIVVFPSDGIGSGLSKLKEKAPRIHAHLKELLEELESIDTD